MTDWQLCSSLPRLRYFLQNTFFWVKILFFPSQSTVFGFWRLASLQMSPLSWSHFHLIIKLFFFFSSEIHSCLYLWMKGARSSAGNLCDFPVEIVRWKLRWWRHWFYYSCVSRYWGQQMCTRNESVRIASISHIMYIWCDIDVVWEKLNVMVRICHGPLKSTLTK